MLGMCGISFLVIFIQFYIIAGLSRKINTLFEIFLGSQNHLPEIANCLRARIIFNLPPGCQG